MVYSRLASLNCKSNETKLLDNAKQHLTFEKSSGVWGDAGAGPSTIQMSSSDPDSTISKNMWYPASIHHYYKKQALSCIRSLDFHPFLYQSHGELKSTHKEIIR